MTSEGGLIDFYSQDKKSEDWNMEKTMKKRKKTQSVFYGCGGQGKK